MKIQLAYTHYQINRELRQNNISLIEYLTLDYLSTGGNITPTKLADYLRVTKPGVVHIVELLVNQEYVERSNSKSDRRLTYLKITTKGMDYLNDIIARFKKASI